MCMAREMAEGHWCMILITAYAKVSTAQIRMGACFTAGRTWLTALSLSSPMMHTCDVENFLSMQVCYDSSFVGKIELIVLVCYTLVKNCSLQYG